MSKGREEEARQTIARLHGLPITDPIIETEWLEIKASVMFDERTAKELHPNARGMGLSLAKVSMLFTNKGLFRRLALGCILMFFQQFTGMSYPSPLLESLHFGIFLCTLNYQPYP